MPRLSRSCISFRCNQIIDEETARQLGSAGSWFSMLLGIRIGRRYRAPSAAIYGRRISLLWALMVLFGIAVIEVAQPTDGKQVTMLIILLVMVGQQAMSLLFSFSGYWWASDKIKTNFFRPLSSLTLALDYSLWPDTPLLMHIHGLLWFFLLILLVYQLYRSVSGSVVVAGVSLLLLVADDVFTTTTGTHAGWSEGRLERGVRGGH